MATIRIAGDTSGYVDLQAPAIAGSVVLTLPANSGTVATLESRSKSISVISPVITDNITFFYTDTTLTVRKVVSVVQGTTPNVTFNLTYANTRATGTVGTDITGSTVCANTTNGVITTTFTNATIPANNYVVLQFSVVTGTVNEIAITML
jgi:hypothetical protein